MAAMAASCSSLASSVSSFTSSKVAGNANAGRKPRSVRMAASIRCQATGKKAEEKEVQRRAVVAGVGVAILSLVASGAANATTPVPPGEPKPGSREALKKYANICVSNPTAQVCHG